MRARTLGILCVFGFLLGLQPLAGAESIKLLAPGVGWMRADHNTILWTSDGGKNWKNIAPPSPRDSTISRVLFLDGEHGWALLDYGEPDALGAMKFEVARTTDGGTNWSVQPLNGQFQGAMTLSFADPDHGCLGLLGTSDGGRTWVSAYKPNLRNPGDLSGCPEIQVTRQFGWLVEGRMSEELYVTRDGGTTWQQVVIPSPIETDELRKAIEFTHHVQRGMMQTLPPAAAAQRAKDLASAPHDYYNDTFAHYTVPVFTSPTHGHIVVSYPGVAVLFGTDDGGLTWTSQAHITGRVVGPSAVTDSTWITADVPRGGTPHLRKLGAGASAVADTPVGPNAMLPLDISFVSPSEGWVLTADGRLLSTTHGGATWTDITPPRSPLEH